MKIILTPMAKKKRTAATPIDILVSELVGEEVIPLVRELKNKKNVSEFKLAEKLKKEVNVARNMLYRLHEANLVTFTRKKDKVKGWYIYYWTLRTKGIKYISTRLKEKQLSQLRERLDREQQGQFHLCPSKCMRLNFEQAFDFSYKCPECGMIMELEDNSAKIISLKKDIEALENDLRIRPAAKVAVAKPVHSRPKGKKHRR